MHMKYNENAGCAAISHERVITRRGEREGREGVSKYTSTNLSFLLRHVYSLIEASPNPVKKLNGLLENIFRSTQILHNHIAAMIADTFKSRIEQRVVDRWLGKIVLQLEFQFNGLENDDLSLRYTTYLKSDLRVQVISRRVD